MIFLLFHFVIRVLWIWRGSIRLPGRFCLGFIECQPKRRHDDPFESGFFCIWLLLHRYCATLAAIGCYCATIGHYWPLLAAIVPLLATIGRYWRLLRRYCATIGRYWPLFVLTRSFRGYLYKMLSFVVAVVVW